MIIPMLCVTIFVILVVWFLLPRVARLMIHTPTAISIFVCLSMVQLMAVFISMRCTCKIGAMLTVYGTGLFLKGLAFGFILAAAVGAMWLLCFRRTVAAGALTGLVSGMGIAVADGIYGAIAAFGLTAVSGLLLAYSFWIGLTGAAFLLWLGISTILAHPAESKSDEDPPGMATAFLSTLRLTLTNPATILAF